MLMGFANIVNSVYFFLISWTICFISTATNNKLVEMTGPTSLFSMGLYDSLKVQFQRLGHFLNRYREVRTWTDIGQQPNNQHTDWYD